MEDGSNQTTKVGALLTGERKILAFMLQQQRFGIDMEPLTGVRDWEEPMVMPGVPGLRSGRNGASDH